MFRMFDEVRIVNSNRQTIKEGIIVRLTSSGAGVFNPKASDEKHYTDLVFGAEWFPFESKELKMLHKGHRRRK